MGKKNGGGPCGSSHAGTRLGELVHWIRGLKHKSGVLTSELNLKGCGEEVR